MPFNAKWDFPFTELCYLNMEMEMEMEMAMQMKMNTNFDHKKIN